MADKTKKFYFVRHGETNRNTKGKLPGGENTADEPLNEKGVAQAKDAGKEIKLASFGRIIGTFSSPIKRAEETAINIIKTFSPGLSLPELHDLIQYDSRLREVDFGKLTGKSWDEIAKLHPNENLEEKYRDQDYDFGEYHGDSYEEVKKRLYEFIRDLKEKYLGTDVLVVTHAGVIRVLYKHEKGEIFETPPPNGSVHIFEF